MPVEQRRSERYTTCSQLSVVGRRAATVWVMVARCEIMNGAETNHTSTHRSLNDIMICTVKSSLRLSVGMDADMPSL